MRAKLSGWKHLLFTAATLATLAAGAVLLATPSTAPISAPRNGAGQAVNTEPSASNLQPAAFTMTRNGDGSVTFTVYDLFDTDAATKALNDAGIVGRILNADTQRCGGSSDGGKPSGLTAVLQAGIKAKITVRSSDYPAGGGILLVVKAGNVNPATGKAQDIYLVHSVYDRSEKIPTCVDLSNPANAFVTNK